MTIRDNIYKEYQKGGEARATLQEGLLPEFIAFIETTEFEKKNVLDIGCGNGKYLAYLKNSGFQTSGADSSETAVEMTKKALGNEGNITCKDMYTMDIEPNVFDLILAIQTIHHGEKQEVKKLIDKIYEALPPKGKIFITLPEYENIKHRNTFTEKKEIAPGTFIPLAGPEKGLPHSFFTSDEIAKMFSDFKNMKHTLNEKGRRIITGEK